MNPEWKDLAENWYKPVEELRDQFLRACDKTNT